MKTRSRAPGGWLLVEVAVGGVMASVIVGALLVNVGDAVDKSAVVGREVTAASLAQQVIEQARALQPPTALADGTTTIAAPSGVIGRYTRTRTVTSGTVTNGALVQSYKDVVAVVAFPLSDGGTKTVRLETRIYTP